MERSGFVNNSQLNDPDGGGFCTFSFKSRCLHLSTLAFRSVE